MLDLAYTCLSTFTGYKFECVCVWGGWDFAQCQPSILEDFEYLMLISFLLLLLLLGSVSFSGFFYGGWFLSFRLLTWGWMFGRCIQKYIKYEKE